MEFKRYTGRDKANFVNSFKAYNLERRDFCNLNNISYSSLHRWLKTHNNNKKIIDSFVPIKMKTNPIKNKTNLPVSNKAILTNMKIKLPNGIEMECKESNSNLSLVDYVKILLEI